MHAGVIYNTGIRTLYTEKMRYDSGIGNEIRESVATRIYITGSDVFLIEGESQMHSRCATEMVRGEEGGGGGRRGRRGEEGRSGIDLLIFSTHGCVDLVDLCGAL